LSSENKNIEILKANGFKVRENKRSISGKKGWVRITSISSYHRVFLVKKRTANGGYTNIESIYDSIRDAIDLANKVLETEEEPPKPNWNKSKLPEPFEFTDGHNIVRKDWGRGVVVEEVSPCREVIIHNVVTIDKKCVVTASTSNPSNDDIWFLVQIYGDSGKYYIITDGEKFRLVRRTTPDKQGNERYKVDLGTSGSGVDRTQLNHVAKEMIRRGIKRFVQKISGASNV